MRRVAGTEYGTYYARGVLSNAARSPSKTQRALKSTETWNHIQDGLGIADAQVNRSGIGEHTNDRVRAWLRSFDWIRLEKIVGAIGRRPCGLVEQPVDANVLSEGCRPQPRSVA